MEISLCVSEALAEGQMLQFELDGLSVLLCRVGDKVYALDGVCPHRGAQLSTGTLEGTTIRCPWHDWEFDCTDGCGLTNPQSELQHYPVSERDGQIWVELPAV